MKTILLAILALTLSSVAFAKDKPKPISPYMRSVGLMYLEEVEELTLQCGQHQGVEDNDCKSNWESTMQQLEDRIEITLSQGPRPSGDKPFYDLLRTTKWTRDMYTSAERDQRQKWAHVDSVCHVYAHTIVKEGEWFSDNGNCDAAISAATN